MLMMMSHTLKQCRCEKLQHANFHPNSCFNSFKMAMPRREQSLSIRASPPLTMSIFSRTHGHGQFFVHSLNITKQSQLFSLAVLKIPNFCFDKQIVFSFKRIFQNQSSNSPPGPAAAASTTTVTSPCSFSCSSNLPAGYVKCFHMKHILVKSVECPVNVPN